MPKQLTLFRESSSSEFGGQRLMGQRKSARPLSSKKSLHLVLKASHSFALLRSRGAVEASIRLWSQRFGIRVYAVAVNADHIHLHLRTPTRLAYVRWIRATTSRLVVAVRGLKFTLRPYSRLVSWGRHARGIDVYMRKNLFEAELVLSAWRIARAARARGTGAVLNTR